MENHSATYRALPLTRGIKRTGQLAKPPPEQGGVASSPKPQPRTSNEIRDLALSAIAEGGEYTVDYLLSVLKIVGNLSRWLIAFGMTGFMLMVIMGLVSTTIHRAFEPLCVIPGISLLSACNPGPSPSLPESVASRTPKWADYSKLMEIETKSFAQLLETAVRGTTLALEIKKTEMATTDLIIRVQISDLKARDKLAASLLEFGENAIEAGTSLHRLASTIGGSIDNVMAVNHYALLSISNARANKPSPWYMKRRISTDPSEEVDRVVMRTFDEAMTVLSADTERLIVEAEHSLLTLNKLEERLITVHELVAQENSSILSAKADLSKDLWTKLGGNRKFLRNYEHRLLVLRGLVVRRTPALAHAVAALQTLKEMKADMEDMRERVVAPDFMGTTIPVEVHMKSIQMGLERLAAERSRARRLKVDDVRKILLDDGFA